MKTTIRTLPMLFTLFFCLSIHAQTKDEIIAKIRAKGQKLNMKLEPGDLQAVDYSIASRAYFLSYNGYDANIYYKVGAPEPYAVWGDIFKLYDKMLAGDVSGGGSNKRMVIKNQKLFIGAPKSDEFATPQIKGAGQHFEGGSIYWSQATGAHEVHGDILGKWKSLGWENSFLGFPTTDETPTPDGYGRFNFFEGGAIYYHPNLGTFAVPKMIAEVWKKNGWEKGKLGYPISDEIIKNNNSVQKFEFGAVISTKASAYQVIYNGTNRQRGLYNKWIETGAENSYLGDLVAPNRNYPKNPFQYFAEFQKGYIYESFTKGTNKVDAFVIKKGPIFNYYASKKWEQGDLGLPVSDELSLGNGDLKQVFQNGTIYYSPTQGAFEKK
jgi:uncharacterized protein with LGFP repeats